MNIEQAIKKLNIPWQAILLVGPSGSGKTPLGQFIETYGLWGRRCLHFDFGSELRASVNEHASPLTGSEKSLVDKMLKASALLEDEHFPIAEKLLLNFLSKRKARENTLVVLNGIPRHVGQARAMEEWIEMQAIVSLECHPEITWERIRTNFAGDRNGRADNTLEKVRRRLKIFRQRTAPLLEYYHARGVRVLYVNVGANTTAEEMHHDIEAKCHQ